VPSVISYKRELRTAIIYFNYAICLCSQLVDSFDLVASTATTKLP